MKVYTDTCPQNRSDSETTHTAAVSEHRRSRFSETITYRWTDTVVVLAQFPCIFLSDPDLGGSCGRRRNTTIYILLHKEKKKVLVAKDTQSGSGLCDLHGNGSVITSRMRTTGCASACQLLSNDLILRPSQSYLIAST